MARGEKIMMFFSNKCKCNCEWNVTRESINTRTVITNTFDSIVDILISAGLIVETNEKSNQFVYKTKTYKVKKVK